MEKLPHNHPDYQKWRRAENKRKAEEFEDYVEAKKEFYKAKGYMFAKPEGWMEKANKKIEEQNLTGKTNQMFDDDGKPQFHKIRNKNKTHKQKQYKATYYKGDIDELWNNMDNMNPDELSKL